MRQAVTTSPSLQEFTISGFGTPKAAMFIATEATADNTLTDEARFSIGFTDGTNQRVSSWKAEHSNTRSNTSRGRSGASVVRMLSNTADTVESEALWSAWVTDGVEIDFTGNASATAYLLTVILFGGDDLQAFVGDITGSATQDATASTTAPGFTPDHIIGVGAHGGYATPAVNSNCLGFLGFCNGPTLDQGGWSIAWRDNHNEGQASGAASDTVWIRQMISGGSGTGTLQAGLEVTSVDANGFTVTTRDSATAVIASYLALEYGGADTWMGRVDTPTSTGVQNNEGPGFEPTAVFSIFSGTNDALDTAVDSDEGGVFGYGVMTENDAFCNEMSNEDGPAVSNTDSIVDDVAVRLSEPGGTSVTATHTFDSLGFNLDFSAVDTIGYRAFYLAVAQVGAATVIVVDETIDISEGVVDFLEGMFVVVVDETVNITEEVLTPRGLVRVVDETVDIGEVVVTARGLVRVINETVEIAEAVQAARMLVAIINETIEIAEALLATRGLIRVIDETVDIGEQTLLPRGLTRVIDETVEIGEQTLLPRGMTHVVDETVEITEQTVLPRGLVRVIDETVEITEALLVLRGLVRVINETVNIEEQSLLLRGLVQVINETVEITEEVLTPRGLVRVIGETVEIGEGLITPRDLVRVIDETINIDELIRTAAARVAVIDETVEIGEDVQALAVAAGVGLVITVNETVNIAEALLAARGLVIEVSETIDITEDFVTPRALVRVIDEGVDITEEILTPRTLVMVVDETVEITEELLTARGLVRVINESVEITEGLVAPRGLLLVIDETVEIGEDLVTVLAGVSQVLIVVNESVEVTEALIAALSQMGGYSCRGITLE